MEEEEEGGLSGVIGGLWRKREVQGKSRRPVIES